MGRAGVSGSSNVQSKGKGKETWPHMDSESWRNEQISCQEALAKIASDTCVVMWRHTGREPYLHLKRRKLPRGGSAELGWGLILRQLFLRQHCRTAVEGRRGSVWCHTSCVCLVSIEVLAVPLFFCLTDAVTVDEAQSLGSGAVNNSHTPLWFKYLVHRRM